MIDPKPPSRAGSKPTVHIRGACVAARFNFQYRDQEAHRGLTNIGRIPERRKEAVKGLKKVKNSAPAHNESAQGNNHSTHVHYSEICKECTETVLSKIPDCVLFEHVAQRCYCKDCNELHWDNLIGSVWRAFFQNHFLTSSEVETTLRLALERSNSLKEIRTTSLSEKVGLLDNAA